MSTLDEALSKFKQLNNLLKIRSNSREFGAKIEQLRSNELAKKFGKLVIGVVGLRQSGKSYLLNVLAKRVSESDFVFGRTGELKELEYYENEDFIFLDTPPLDSNVDFQRDFINYVDVCLWVHDINRDCEDCELDFLRRYRDREYGSLYPTIIVLTHLEGIEDETELSARSLTMSIVARNAQGVEDDDEDIDLGIGSCNPMVIPFRGPEFIDLLKIMGFRRYGYLFNYKIEDIDRLRAQGLTVYEGTGTYEPSMLVEHSSMGLFLLQLYGSMVYDLIQKLHTAVDVAKRIYTLQDYFSEEGLSNLLVEFMEAMQEGVKEIDSYRENFEYLYRKVLSAQRMRNSIHDSAGEVLQYFNNLRTYAGQNTLYKFDAQKEDYDFKSILLNAYSDEDLVGLITITSMILPEAGEFVLEHGPKLTYEKSVKFFERKAKRAITDRSRVDDDDAFAVAQDLCATTIIIQQVIFGADVTISQNLFDFLQELDRLIYTINGIDFDEDNEFDEYAEQLEDVIDEIEDEIEDEVYEFNKSLGLA